MTTVAVLGVGRVGSALARALVAAGYRVHVASSQPGAEIALLTEVVIPGATALDAPDAVREADIVVLAVPLHKHTTVDPQLLASKVVVDAMNYWAPVDGIIADFEDPGTTSSEVVARHFAHSRLVKAFNHIGYHDLEEHATPKGTPGRRALAVASDHCDAAIAVADLVDRIGFDAVQAGPLAAGAALEPGTAVFNGSFTARELADAIELDAARLAG
ncbi:NADPH-dependent F420 reductase [Aestuariimicrobium sp. Y1814]|uniref:NADPH-dependent F420 reductase n=1 Tax=Aestuariimicrobium sp. Y1814 TaxID=3418742 RepID=UPI003DA6EA0A